MLHKQIIAALILSCVFALGNSQRTCSDEQKYHLTQNICSNITLATECLCLNSEQTYELIFESPEICERVRKQFNGFGVNECLTKQLQTQLNLEVLESVCGVDGIVRVSHQPPPSEKDNLCQPIIPSQDCHSVAECITLTQNLTNICDNLTLVEAEQKTFNESEIYIVVTFSQTNKGKVLCNRTANRLNESNFRPRKNIVSKLYAKECTEPEKLLSSTLNLNGLKWVCNRKQVTRVTFEETYFNESVCRNITKAQHYFFPNDKKTEDFKVSYLIPNAADKCNILVDGLKKPGIGATIALENNNCTHNPSVFQGTLTYEALKFVCNHTDLSEVAVVQEKITDTVGPAGGGFTIG